MIRKEKTFENFVKDKIANLSESSRESIIYSNRMFDEFCQKTHNQSFDDIIKEARADEYPDEFVLVVNSVLRSDLKVEGGKAIRSENATEIGYLINNESGNIGNRGTLQAPFDSGTVPAKSTILSNFGDFNGALGIYFNNSGSPVLTIKRPDGKITAVTLSTNSVFATEIA